MGDVHYIGVDVMDDMGDVHYIGVDVGTSSARAALVSNTGEIISSASHAIHIFEPQEDYFEQSSENIWQACCKVVQAVIQGIDPASVKGIGFDATCSLVVLGERFQPVSVSPSGNVDMNIVMWMDHRAAAQTDQINSKQHEVTKYVGGKVSLEMQTPKLLWLKENLKQQCWDNAGHFFDLPDFLTWKATGCLTRSLCSVVCKWTYLANVLNAGWNLDYFEKIGLGDLSEGNFAKIGNVVQKPGEAVGAGLCKEAAQALGLVEGTPVGTSLIDAHAGGLGTMGCSPRVGADSALGTVPQTSRLGLICGTSTCHMAVSEDPLFVKGVWGPYYSAMIPGLWLSEGGQSATGKLIDHVLETHPSYSWLLEEAKSKDQHIHDVLHEVLQHTAKQKGIEDICQITKDVHVWPDYHGNRSPLADPMLRGMVCGLSISSGVEDLARQYLATVQALAYGTKHIIQSMEEAGHSIRLLLCCGGLSKNSLFVQTHADATGLPVVLPDANESVLLGAAILGACASGNFGSVQDAMISMGGQGTVLYPDPNAQIFHRKKYKVFLQLGEHQRQYQKVMRSDVG